MAITADGLAFSWGGTWKGKRGQKGVSGMGNKFEPLVLDYFADMNLKIKHIACG